MNTLAKLLIGLVLLLTTVATVSATDWRWTHAPGGYNSVSIYEPGRGSYGVTTTPRGDVYGGWSTRSNRGSFGYSDSYGLSSASACGSGYCGGVYRTSQGTYAGNARVGQRLSTPYYGYGTGRSTYYNPYVGNTGNSLYR
jgi:hypothetical protein